MTMTSRDLLAYSNRHHLMLLYDDDLERSSAEIGCINKALAAGQYCVYATVDASDNRFESKLAARIENYDRHIREGNLVVVNFRPFYEAAANGELDLFKELKSGVESTLENRKSIGKIGKALVVADAACNLTKNKQFDQCVTLEGWWQHTYKEWMAKGLDITIICAHPSSVLKHQAYSTAQHRISDVHSLTLDLNVFANNAGRAKPNNMTEQVISILVAEPEPDICEMYEKYFKSLPIDLTVAASGRECLERSVTADPFDMIIIDTHMKDVSGLQIAKKLLEENKDQQIVFTTTWNFQTIVEEFGAHSLDINRYAVLQKPFRFSELLAVIKPASSKNAT